MMCGAVMNFSCQLLLVRQNKQRLLIDLMLITLLKDPQRQTDFTGKIGYFCVVILSDIINAAMSDSAGVQISNQINMAAELLPLLSTEAARINMKQKFLFIKNNQK